MELRLRGRRRISGIVASEAGGGIPGARVKVIGGSGPPPNFSWVQADLQGRFEAFVSPGSTDVLVTAAAPGFALRMLRVPMPETDSVVGIRLGQESGTVVVRVPGEDEAARRQNLVRMSLQHGNGAELLQVLEDWSRANRAPYDGGPSMTLPAMEPGPYALCLESAADCVSGYLAPGGVLELAR